MKPKIHFGKIAALFLQITTTIAITLLVSFGSFFVVRTVFHGADNARISALANEIAHFNIQTAVDTTPVTVICAIDETDNTIEHIVLEVLQCESRRLTYINIPCSSRFTIGDELYRELSAGLPQFPQVVTLSECFRYYGNTDGIDAIADILSDMLGVKIPYCVSLPSDIYSTVFLALDDAGGTTSGFALPFTDKLSLARGNSIYDLLTELSINAYSNITLQDKLIYLETYDSIDVHDVRFESAPGNAGVASFTPDFEAFKLILYKAMYTTQQ